LRLLQVLAMRYGHLSEVLRAVSRLAIVGIVGGMAAACSTGSARFAENPFANPFGEGKESGPAMTGSIDPSPRASAIAPMPRSTISSAPLAAPGVSRSDVAPAYTPSASSSSVANVSGLNPDFNKRAAPSRMPSPAPAAKLTQAAPAPVQGKVVTRYQLVEGKKPAAETSRAAPARPSAAAKAEEPAKVAHPRPGKTTAAAPAQPALAPQVAAAPQKPVKAAEPVKTAAVAAPAKPIQPEPVKPAPAKEPEATGALPASPTASADFRWPARGRVISGFGGSGSNEGINIAVPEGTPVKAAEAGTVAYAGSEVKGYGNLVLIRHDNGYVSAYAHNGEIEVKRGQKVARGQVVAKSGQSGNVTSPQLHFEIRKGSTPVDPMPHLASN
jgi:murein DD-endopeptidase MepM/ murein hydrolase activator NlpD